MLCRIKMRLRLPQLPQLSAVSPREFRGYALTSFHSRRVIGDLWTLATLCQQFVCAPVLTKRKPPARGRPSATIRPLRLRSKVLYLVHVSLVNSSRMKMRMKRGSEGEKESQKLKRARYFLNLKGGGEGWGGGDERSILFLQHVQLSPV